jgi:transketolase
MQNMAQEIQDKNHQDKNQVDYRKMANAIRALSMDAVQKANSGHPGMPMGMADVATILFSKYMKFSAANPLWPDRDRFILSAGHGSMLLYSVAYLTGYEKMTMDEIKNFRQLHSLTAGHPEIMPEVGIETTTGPLGQGIANAVGFALAERILNARFGDLTNHMTYVIASDGDMMEGISHEACALAGHLNLSKLVVLYDDNGISIDGPTSLSYSDDVPKRFEAYGWDVQTIDGHDHQAIDAAIAKAIGSETPSLICCKTHIGFGAPTKQDSSSSHGSPLGEEEIKGTREALDWPYEPFEVPDEILENWRMIGARGNEEFDSWNSTLNNNLYKNEYLEVLRGDVSEMIQPLIMEIKKKFEAEQPKMATRQSSGKVLEFLVPAMPFLIGGSADLTGSNNTQIKGPQNISKDDFSGQYIYYGVREHGMAAAMNGMTLHGGVIPYSGTFLQFSDYCRPAIRLAALMKQRVIHVMTHDSIGLGEDGPTHQPVEHLAALRAIPNVTVLRPADAIETAECWQVALERMHGPSILALTRQGLPTVRTATDENLSARGAYILKECEGAPEVTIFASGSEVEIAIEAAMQLGLKGTQVRVVSVPSLDLFQEQDGSYIEELTCNGSIKVAVEAGVRQGWDSLIGPHGIFVGMSTFGESAPADILYKHFNITPEAIVARVQARLDARKEAS